MDVYHAAMKHTTLTYNLHYNRASSHLNSVIKQCNPGIIFLQELLTDERSLSNVIDMGYELADFSNSFLRKDNIYGVATFYKPTLYKVRHRKSLSLPSSVIQMMTFLLKNRKNPRTVLRTDFEIKKSPHILSTYNIHFTPPATNTLRLKQLGITLGDIAVNQKTPLVIAGDFNYPYGRKKLEEMLAIYHLQEATNNILFTSQQKFILKKFSIKLKLDYVFYRNITLLNNERVEVHHSDHFPILSTFEL